MNSRARRQIHNQPLTPDLSAFSLLPSAFTPQPLPRSESCSLLAKIASAKPADTHERLTCTIAPVYASLCQSLQVIAEADRQALPIEACTHWAAKQPYDLDDGCIRRTDERQGAMLNRIRKGWGKQDTFTPH